MMTSFTRLLAFAVLCVVCATLAVAAMYILFLAWVPVIRIVDAAFGWMQAHDTATSAALVVVFVGVLVAIWRKDS